MLGQGLVFGAILAPALAFRNWQSSLPDCLEEIDGKADYETLEAITGAFPEAFEGTHQQEKSALTRAITDKRKVSEQVARANKRSLSATVSEQMKQGNRDLIELRRASGVVGQTGQGNVTQPENPTARKQ